MGAKLLASTQANPGGLPTRLLGRTGERVPILCLGGWHIGALEDGNEAIRIMHSAIDQGLTFFDNCWDYQDGHSEKLMGRALASEGRRQKIFLMTKNCERDYAGSLKNLEDSLGRLRTDYVDLWQFHELVYDNDPDWVLKKVASRRHWKPGVKARCVTSGLPVTRILVFTSRCWRNPLTGIRRKCPSTSWTPITAASRMGWSQFVYKGTWEFWG